MAVKRTAHFFSALSIPFATKKCSKRSTYWSQSSLVLSNSSTRPSVAVVIPQLVAKICRIFNINTYAPLLYTIHNIFIENGNDDILRNVFNDQSIYNRHITSSGVSVHTFSYSFFPNSSQIFLAGCYQCHDCSFLALWSTTSVKYAMRSC